MFRRTTGGGRLPTQAIWSLCRRAIAGSAALLLMGALAMPVRADDDDDRPQPPTAAAKDAAARTTAVVLGLIAGVGVYYFVQRHRLMNGHGKPPEWDQKMNRNAIVFAIVSAVAVGGVCAAFSLAAPPPKRAAPAQPAPNTVVPQKNPNVE
ncbi:MAG TPA: hypothetical protein VKT77_01055 [Chthonomonadaceae bacterium]|nr:hypothetical protein [Chthonomonadaceae bacterium]